MSYFAHHTTRRFGDHIVVSRDVYERLKAGSGPTPAWSPTRFSSMFDTPVYVDTCPCDEERHATLEHTDETMVNVHLPDQCAGEFCTLHNRSDHSMRHLPQHWRQDRGIMERICEHGVGHPDPDDSMVTEWPEVFGIHGCDGCCA